MNTKQKYIKALKLTALVAIVISSIPYFSNSVSAAPSDDYCNGFGYTNANLAGCKFGYDTASKGSAADIKNACTSAGYDTAQSDRAACAVGAGIVNNKNLGSGAQAACESVGYTSAFLADCIKSYNENSGKTEAELKKACGDTGNTCYVGGKLKNLTPATVNNPGTVTLTKDYCDRVYGTVDPKEPAAAKAAMKKQQDACNAGQDGKDCNTYTNDAEKLACNEGTQNSGDNGAGAPGSSAGSGGGGACGGAKTNLIKCDGEGVQAIGGVLKLVITIMTVGIGILAVGGIAYGALLYASAQDNAGQTKKAVEVITNTVIGLLLYLFMIAIVNWLVPGGVIG